jgi:prepilin-type N-terminal cleavage/methylation domain-containing protein
MSGRTEEAAGSAAEHHAVAEAAARRLSHAEPALAGRSVGASAFSTRRGFTLIEVIAVLIVTAIMGALAVGSLGSLSSSRAADAGRTVLQDVSFARDRAMSTGLPHWVVFDAAAESYSVLVDSTGGGYASAAALTDPATGSAMVVRLNREQHSGVFIEYVSFDDATVVGFDWLGRPLLADGQRIAKEGQVQLTGGVTVSLDVTSGAPRLVLP